MKVLKQLYEKMYHQEAPYYYDYSIFKMIGKPIRKWLTNVVAANCPFNSIRILIYRLCGFKIGKKCFIGMHCYLDDMCYELMMIGDFVTISYGVYFACHGRNQEHFPIIVKDNAYIGMRASVISKNSAYKQETRNKKQETRNKKQETRNKKQGVIIGNHAIVGACALVNKDVPDYATAVGVPCRIIEDT